MWYLWHLNALESACGVNFTPDDSVSGEFAYELKYKDSGGEKKKYAGKRQRNQSLFDAHYNFWDKEIVRWTRQVAAASYGTCDYTIHYTTS